MDNLAMPRKLVEMPRRRGIWLHPYEDIRTRTPFAWFAYSVLGTLGLLGGIALLWLVFTLDIPKAARFIEAVIAIPAIGFGILEVPAGIIYLIRRRRGEPIDLWDFETPDDPAVQKHRHLQP